MIEYNREINICAPNNGYVCFMDKDHPIAQSTGRVYLHRHLMSMHLGRWLQSDEIVHHIDGNPINNHIDNLQVLTAAEHAHSHKGKLEELACPICAIKFMPNTSSRVFCSPKCSQVSQLKDVSLTKEMLDELIPLNTWTALGKIFGYSDNGIKKRAIALGCTIPTKKRGPVPK